MTDLKDKNDPLAEIPTEIELDDTKWNRWYIFVLFANIIYILIFLLVKLMNQ